MKRKLFLITDFFPYGNGEAFVMTELRHLCRYFDVTVIPRYVGEGTPRQLPEGVTKLDVARSARLGEKVRFVFGFFLGRWGREEIAAAWKSGENRLARIKKSLLAYASAELFWNELKESGAVAAPADAVYYSFWYTSAALALSFHRDELAGAKTLVRTNGYDLYNDRAAGGRQPFKPAADREFDMVVSSCRYGMDYYKNTFGETDGVKYLYSALGSDDSGHAAVSQEGVFHLVSCSNAFPVKRIHRIIEGLALQENVPLQWTHFGDGEELEELKAQAAAALAEKTNIRFHFAGSVPHETILAHYGKEPVDCFITTSASEGGCPVSIQEAMAFGIPVIGTAVGGITEMLADSENILLSEDVTAEEVARAIERMRQMSPEEREALRSDNRNRWKQRYNAAENARNLADEIMKLWE